MLPIIIRRSSRRGSSAGASHAGVFASPVSARARMALAVGLTLGAVASAHSADLGSLRVLSASGEPLRAEIDVTSLTPDQAASLKVGLAGPEIYQRVHVDYQPVVASLSLALEDRADGRKVVGISSSTVVDTPVIDLLVELSWNTGHFIRQYSFVIHSSQATASAPSVGGTAAAGMAANTSAAEGNSAVDAASAAAGPASAAGANGASGASSSATPSPAGSSAASPSATGSASTAGNATAAGTPPKSLQVARGDTLLGLASQVQLPGMTVTQTLAALLRANPQAFIDGNMNLLRADASLTVPSAQQVGAVSVAESQRLFAEQNAAFDSYRQHLATSAGTAAPAGSAAAGRQAQGRIQAASPDTAQAPQSAGDELRLSGSADASSGAQGTQAARDRLQEERDANGKALAEAQSRVKELQGNVDAMKGLLSAQNQTLAGMEKSAGVAPQTGSATDPAADHPAVGNAAADKPASDKPADAAATAASPPAADAASTTDGSPPPSTESTPVPPAATAAAPQPASTDASSWLHDRSLAVLAAVLAALALILGFFAARRRAAERQALAQQEIFNDQASLSDTEAHDELIRDWGPILPFPAAESGTIQRSIYADVSPDDDEYEDEDREGVPPGHQPPTPPASFGFDLDLDDKLPDSPPAAPPAASSLDIDTDVAAPDTASKLATARAYLDLGDRKGARELLDEVLRDGNEEQRRQARDAIAVL